MMIDTNELLEALYARHLSTPALVAAFPGGCYIEVAPAGTGDDGKTYLVLEVAASPMTHSYGSASSANPTILFKAVGLQRGATAAALKAWTDLLDNPATSVTGAYSFSRQGGAVDTYIGPNEAGNAHDLWQWAAAFEFNTNY